MWSGGGDRPSPEAPASSPPGSEGTPFCRRLGASEDRGLACTRHAHWGPQPLHGVQGVAWARWGQDWGSTRPWPLWAQLGGRGEGDSWGPGPGRASGSPDACRAHGSAGRAGVPRAGHQLQGLRHRVHAAGAAGRGLQHGGAVQCVAWGPGTGGRGPGAGEAVSCWPSAPPAQASSRGALPAGRTHLASQEAMNLFTRWSRGLGFLSQQQARLHPDRECRRRLSVSGTLGGSGRTGRGHLSPWSLRGDRGQGLGSPGLGAAVWPGPSPPTLFPLQSPVRTRPSR